MDMSPQQVVPSEFDEIETGVPELPAPPTPTPAARDAAEPARRMGMEAVHGIPVKVQAVLGGAKMPISELLQTHAGSVIELDRRVGEPVDVLVNDRLVARGELVLIDGSLGVTLTEIVKQER
jgi:flagellar motor switch protein FliN/FliY